MRIHYHEIDIVESTNRTIELTFGDSVLVPKMN